MKITSILKPESIIPRLESTERDPVLRELATAICLGETSIDPEQIFKVLREREELGSTGIGCGIAIPHGKLSHLEKIIAAFGRSEKGIDFDSQDGEPVNLFFALIAPENAAGLHLKVLAKLSRLLKVQSFRESLTQANEVDALFAIIDQSDQDYYGEH